MKQEKKGMREGMDPRPGNENKAIGLTSHSTTMNLMIQSPGNGMVPRQCLGKISYLLEGTSPEQGAQTVVFQRQVPQRLQHIEQDGKRYSVQYQRLE